MKARFRSRPAAGEQREEGILRRGGALEALRAIAVLAVCLGSTGCLTRPFSLTSERSKYEARADKLESDREHYVERLARARESLAASGKTEEAFGVDAEIKKHPAPPEAVRWMSLRVGRWESPRHEYVFRKDLTWSMLPEDDQTTHGWWKVEGNQLIEGYAGSVSGEKPGQYTILLLTSRQLIFTDGEAVFYQKRMSGR